MFSDDDTKMNDTENSDTSNEIGFHEVHNPNIYLLNDNKIARKGPDDMLSGICFTNQPLNVGENIYLRIVETEANVGCLDFGVTNTNPAVSINNQSITSIYSKGSILLDAKSNIPHEQLNIDDVCCLRIENNASISFSINMRPTITLSLKNVSINKPMWLAFDLWGTTRAIEISKRKPNIKCCGPYFTDEIFS